MWGLRYQYNTGALFKGITTDVTGPYPENHRRNQYPLIGMEYFTQWLEVGQRQDEGPYDCLANSVAF
jgi:hypothetical protein